MKLFEGVYTALVTPFIDNKIDFDSLENLIEQQLKGGVVGFVVNGTTAESPALTEEESLQLLDFVKEKVKARGKIVFGSGSNNTDKTIEMSKKAEAHGADGLLVVVPYYNKPPQEGLYAHFKKVAESVSTPIMLYNVPGRTVAGLAEETVLRLSEIKNIVAIKEASGDVQFGKGLIDKLPKSFVVSSGDDGTCLSLKAQGSHGVVSVCSHVMPKKMTRWFHQKFENNFLQEFSQYESLISALYISTNPIPVKAALKMLGIIKSDEVRLPLYELNQNQKRVLEDKISLFKQEIL